MMEIDEIREKLSSRNLEILKQSLMFVTERIANERARALRAENRAVATLTFSGVLSGIVVVRLQSILQEDTSFNWALIFAPYVVTILFLLKSALFAFKALGAMKRYEVTPELVFELQGKSEINALREEITYKIWEYNKLIPVGSTRLFWVARAQRNILAAVVTFSVLGISLILLKKTDLHLAEWLNIFMIAVSIISIFLLDFVVEKWSSFWHWN